MKIISKYVSENRKSIAIRVIILIILLGISMPISYNYYMNRTKNKAIDNALVAESVLSREVLLTLENSEDDISSQRYKDLLQNLNNIANSANSINAAYILKNVEGKIIIVASPKHKNINPGTVLYDSSRKETVLIQTNEPIILDKYEDLYGKWVTVIVPIKNHNSGEIIGYFCNDYSHKHWNNNAIICMFAFGAILSIVYILSIALYIVIILNIRLFKQKNALLLANDEISQSHKEIENKIIEIKESEKRLSELFNLVPTMMVMTKKDGRIYNVNKAFLDKLGYTEEEIIGKTIDDINLFDNQNIIIEIKNIYKEWEPKQIKETTIKDKKSNSLVVLISVDKIDQNLGDNFIITMIDISKRKEVEEQLEMIAQKYKTIVTVSDTGVWEHFIKSNEYVFSNEYLAMLGREDNFNNENGEGTIWSDIVHPDDKERAVKDFRNYIKSQSTSLYENCFRMQHRDGHWVWVLSRGRRLLNDDGKLSDTIVGTHIDITDLKKQEEQIKHLNYHDQLTGLYNRRFYDEVLQTILLPQNLPLAIIMADVNGLKLTNDAFGHIAGDNLLKRVAEIISNECRTQDIVARVGGDEFVVLMPLSESKDAERMVQRINQSLNDVKIDNIVISVSFGWATKKDDNEGFKEVYKRAEYRMYRRKLSERNSKRSEGIKIIFSTLKEKHPQEKEHSERVYQYAAQIGNELELSYNEQSELGAAALMHDIGKIGLEESILNKPGRLNDAEWKTLKQHSEIGYRILSSANEFNIIAEYVLHHHERWDGYGYPRGLKGEEIPLVSRIICVADSYDAMTSIRCYKQSLTKKDAIEELKKNAGSQFDANIARVFVEKVLKEKW